MRYQDLLASFVKLFVFYIHKQQTEQLILSFMDLNYELMYIFFLIEEVILNFAKKLLSDYR